jgi:transposase InsO family protein
MTFLRNHKDVIAAMDFFVIPTVGFRLLTIWFIIDHGRRRIVHFKVTTKPSEQWVIQQLRESFPYDSAPRYLIYDNDSIFSDKVTDAIKYLGIEPKRTAYRSPWQNRTAERCSVEVRPSLDARVVGSPRVGGLHHRYTWREAA